MAVRAAATEDDMNKDLLNDVAAMLTARGCLSVRVKDGCVVGWAEDLVMHPHREGWFGTANRMWAGDFYERDVYLNQTLHTAVPSDCTDAARIARGIIDVLENPEPSEQ